MTGLGFVIAPTRLVKGENQFDDFRGIIPDLFNAAKRRADDIWKGFSFGGVRPGASEYGITTIRPRDIYGPGGNTAAANVTGTATFVKTYGSQGSWCNIWSYTVPTGEIHAFAGIAIPDPTLIFAQLRLELDDRKFPIWDIEEAQMYPGGFAIMFKQDKDEEYIAVEASRVLLKGFQERLTRGRQQRVVPLGFQFFRNKDLHITERETGN